MTNPRQQSARLTIPTSFPHLRLVELAVEDADAYFALVRSSLDHLIQHGDYLSMESETIDSFVAEFAEPEESNLRMGIWLDETLIGRADLIPKAPGKCVIGYWLGAAFTGHGYATEACRTLIDYGRIPLAIDDVYAGVTKGNTASEALLRRLGFQLIADMSAYNWFRPTLKDQPDRKQISG